MEFIFFKHLYIIKELLYTKIKIIIQVYFNNDLYHYFLL